MNPQQASRWLALAVVVLLVPWPPVGAVGPAPVRQGLHLHFASFDPLTDPLPPGFALGRLLQAGPFIVQFPYPMGGWERRAVEDAGGAVAAYLPDGAVVVAAGPDFPAKARATADVRWVGALPAWARLAPGAEEAGRVQVSYTGTATSLLEAVRLIGARPLSVGRGTAVFDNPPGGARALAGLSQVFWVEPYHPPASLNFQAVTTDALRAPANGSSYDPSGGGLWTTDGAGGFYGYTGAGYAVDVTDLGVDGTHPGFAGRMEAYKSWTGSADWTDLQGHGTHVAGTAVGSGALLPADSALPGGLFAGAAPGAGLIAQVYNGSALDYAGMADFASTSGAIASVNSWGDPASATLSNYTAASAAYDALTADAGAAGGAQPLLFVFAAGNENQAARSILPPATAKNVITVGGTGNDYPGGTASDDVAPFSSFGPTDDVRIKPDLVAPGERIGSANSTQDAGSGLLPRPASGGSSYVYLSGTSQAAPQVAGATAVAAHFLWDTEGIAATPALIKAALLNGATPLAGYAWPGPAQGWGRLNVHDALVDSPGHAVEFVPEGTYTFSSTLDVYQVNLDLDPGFDLRVTLVWTDAAGSPLASSALVNDLDLEVRDPSDLLIYGGNRINTTTGYSFSGPGGGDHTNNVEVVRVQAAVGGEWKVVVRPYNLPAGAQGFALVISGAVNETVGELSLAPEAAHVDVDTGGSTPLNVSVTNLGNSSENVTLNGTPMWANASSWSVAGASVTLGAGEQRAVALVVSTNDSGSAGFRGNLLLRATVERTGRSYETTVGVNLSVRHCIDQDPFLDRADGGIFLYGGERTDFSFNVTNCGNAATVVGLEVDDPSCCPPWVALEWESQNVSIGPGQTKLLVATFWSPFEMPDRSYQIQLALRSPEPEGTVDVSVTRDTGIRLSPDDVPANVVLHGTKDNFTIKVTNEGIAGTFVLPLIGVFGESTITQSPQLVVLDAGESLTVRIGLARATEEYPMEEEIWLVSWPWSDPPHDVRIDVRWEPTTKSRAPTGPWPTDTAPGLALLAGLAAAGLAGAISARSRALPRTCPHCGKRAARFDTFMNPSCSGCGATLAPPGRSR